VTSTVQSDHTHRLTLDKPRNMETMSDVDTTEFQTSPTSPMLAPDKRRAEEEHPLSSLFVRNHLDFTPRRRFRARRVYV
jgi:hypothetical protein